MRIRLVLTTLVLTIMQANSAICYEARMHQEINRLAIENLAYLGKLDPNAHLERIIGLTLDSAVDGTELRTHVIRGGASEDEPVLRSMHHFHDPTRDAGLVGVSAASWALGTVQSTWPSGSVFGGDYS